MKEGLKKVGKALRRLIGIGMGVTLVASMLKEMFEERS